MVTNRRGFLLGLGAALAAPAIIPIDNLMRVRGIIVPRWQRSPTRFLPIEGGGGYLYYDDLYRTIMELCGFANPELFLRAAPLPA